MKNFQIRKRGQQAKYVADFSIKLFICKHLTGNFLIFWLCWMGRTEQIKSLPRMSFKSVFFTKSQGKLNLPLKLLKLFKIKMLKVKNQEKHL